MPWPHTGFWVVTPSILDYWPTAGPRPLGTSQNLVTATLHNVLGNAIFFLFPLAALRLFRALRRREADSLPESPWYWRFATSECWSGTPSGGSAWPNVPASFCPRLGCSSLLRNLRARPGEAVAGGAGYALAAKDSPGGLTDEDAPWLSRITTAV
jgi:hypothetical protein